MYKKYLKRKISYNELTELIKELIFDIEENCKLYACYAYPKTIRSILTACTYSDIAHHFSDKEYFGIFQESIFLSQIIKILDKMCSDGMITYLEVKNKKRYKSIEHPVEDDLSDEELEEIHSLLNFDEVFDE